MHPIIFQTQHLTLYTFWVFFGLAIISGTYSIIKLSKLNNLKIQFLSDNILSLLLVSIIGARIVSVIKNYQTYFYEFEVQEFVQILYIWDKGLSAWGGIIAFFVFFFYLCKKNNQNFAAWLDILIPSFIITIAISSLGAFFDGINYGKETSLPWGVNFESPNIKYTVPIHPTQIYSFMYSSALAVLLIILNQSAKIKEKKGQGFLAVFGILLFAILRFLEEFLRGDDTWLFFGIRLPQIFAGLTILLAGIFLIKKYTHSENNNEPNSNTNEKSD